MYQWDWLKYSFIFFKVNGQCVHVPGKYKEAWDGVIRLMRMTSPISCSGMYSQMQSSGKIHTTLIFFYIVARTG